MLLPYALPTHRYVVKNKNTSANHQIKSTVALFQFYPLSFKSWQSSDPVGLFFMMKFFPFSFSTHTEHLNQIFSHCGYSFNFFLPLVYVTYFLLILKHCFEKIICTPLMAFSVPSQFEAEVQSQEEVGYLLSSD